MKALDQGDKGPAFANGTIERAILICNLMLDVRDVAQGIALQEHSVRCQCPVPLFDVPKVTVRLAADVGRHCVTLMPTYRRMPSTPTTTAFMVPTFRALLQDRCLPTSRSKYVAPCEIVCARCNHNLYVVLLAPSCASRDDAAYIGRNGDGRHGGLPKSWLSQRNSQLPASQRPREFVTCKFRVLPPSPRRSQPVGACDAGRWWA